MEEHPSEICVAFNPTKEQLFEAATTGNVEILSQISDPRFAAKQNPQGDTACHVALQQGHLEFAMEIASLHPPVLYTSNVEGDTVLHRALKIGQADFFVQSANLIREYLGENIKYPNTRKVNPLWLEARRCYNSSWDSAQRSLLYLAAEKGYFEAVKILLRTPTLNSTDSSRRMTDHHWSVGYREIFQNLRKPQTLDAIGKSSALHGCRRSTALHAAVRNRHYGIVQQLAQRNRHLIFVEDEDGRTPMYIAVMLKCVKMCYQLLLVATKSRALIGTRVIICGRNDASAFLLAAQNDDCLEIFRLFVGYCCQSWYLVRDSHGGNVLHAAVKAEALGIVRLIMEHKISRQRLINERDNDGNTPVSLATVCNGNEEMLNALLTSLEDKEGKAKENYYNSLLVMATLITTVTFAAAFSLPGGYKSDHPNEGTAALIGSAAFRVFLVCDTTSFLTSISSIACIIAFAGHPKIEKLLGFDILNLAVHLVSWSLTFMLAAFAAGLWAVIGSECKWLTILITAMTSVVIYYINPFTAPFLLG